MKSSFNLILTSLCLLLMSVSATAESEKNEFKKLLKQLTAEERLEAVSRADIMNEKINSIHTDSPEKIAEIDMVQEISNICGSSLSYSADKNQTKVNWPTASCKYHQDNNSLSGGTKKFNCDFTETKNGVTELKTRKVKYSGYFGLSKSELVPTLLASSIARLLGFHTESYCPARIKCENCPSDDPWSQNRSSANPGSETIEFKYSIVEIPVKLMTITTNTQRAASSYPPGLFWKELLTMKDSEKSLIREKVIEREAWILWVNFLADTDAFNFNQRLSCKKASLKDDKVYCEKPVAYTHDYGHSFYYRFQFQKWVEYQPLIQNSDGTCSGGLSNKLMRDERKAEPSTDLLYSPKISSEARDFLVSRLSNISEKQWRDIFKISNADRLFNLSTDDWYASVKNKIETMKRIRCAPLDSRTSVLSSGL